MEVLSDQRLGNTPRYYLNEGENTLMLVPDEVRKCVVFVIYKNKTTHADTLAGTAFFVSIDAEFGVGFVYLVTAKHVIDGIKEKSFDSKIYLRVNQKNKASIVVATEPGQWLYHPTLSMQKNGIAFVDVAILPFAPNLEILDCRFIPSTMAATTDIITKEGIGCGDEVFITGLFSQHFGLERNAPIIRIGNIACMPEEPVHTDKYGSIDAYLVEARSIGGLSGSPVFVHLSGIRQGSLKLGTEPIYWLGLIHGHFDLMGQELDITSQDNLYNLAINMGVAIVVPVTKILEVLNQDELIKQRKLAIDEHKLKISPTPDTISTT